MKELALSVTITKRESSRRSVHARKSPGHLDPGYVQGSCHASLLVESFQKAIHGNDDMFRSRHKIVIDDGTQHTLNLVKLEKVNLV